MKQTNNAIKFLMAQYRAIFKNANIAMLAAIAAAALAAGQAQAADLTLSQDKAKPTESLDISEPVDASGHAGGFVNNITIKNKGTLNFNGSSAPNTGHISVANTLTVQSGGTLNLSGTAAGQAGGGWGVVGTHAYNEKNEPLFANANSTFNLESGGAVTITKSQIQMTNVNLNGGTVTIATNHQDNADSDFADNAQINAITNAAGQGGVLTVNGATVNLNNGSILNGKTVDLKKGTIKMSGDGTSGSGSVIRAYGGGSVNLAGAELTTDGTDNYIAAAKVNMTSGAVTIKNGTELHLVGAVRGDNNLSSAAAGKFNISGGTFTVSSGGTLNIKGDATFAKNTLKVVSGSKIDLGTLASGDAARTLNVDSADIKAMLESGNALVGSGTATNEFILNLSETSAIDLAAQGLVQLGDDANLGKISAGIAITDAQLTVKGNEAKFLKEKFNDGTGYEFNTLTVGDSNTFVLEGKAKVTVHNALNVSGSAVDADTALNVTAGALTLDGSGSVGAKTVKVSGSGADDAKLNVKGNWSVGNLTLNSGASTLTDAELTVGGKLTTDTGATVTADNSKIKVLGENADFKFTAGTITLNNVSELHVDQADILENKALKSGVYTKDTVKADANSKLVIKPTSGTSIALTKAEFGQFVDDTGFNGIIEGFALGDDYKPGAATGGQANLSDIQSNYTDAKHDKVQAIVGTDGVKANYSVGSVELAESVDSLTLGDGGDLTLTNANAGKGAGNFVSKKGGAVADVSMSDTNGNSLTLDGSGTIGAIKTTNKGRGEVTFGTDKNVSSNVTVKGTVGDSTNALAVVTTNGSNVTVSGGDLYAYNINLNGGSLALDTGKKVVIGAGNPGLDSTITGDLSAGEFSVAASSTGDINMSNNAVVDVDVFNVSSDVKVNVGKDGVENGGATLLADTFVLKGASLIVDPDYGQEASKVVIQNITDDASKTDAQTVGGNVYVGANSVVSIGYTQAEFDDVMADYLVQNGGFSDQLDGSVKNGVKNALVLNKSITIANKAGIVVDPSKKGTDLTSALKQNTVVLGDGAALIISDKAFGTDKKEAAIKFSDNTAPTQSGSISAATGSKVVLVGDFDENDTELKLAVKSGGAVADGLTTVNVVYAGGLLKGEYNNGTFALKFQPDQAGAIYDGVSRPVADAIVAKLKGQFKDKNAAGYGLLTNLIAAENYKAVDAAAHAATYAGAQQAAVAAVTTMADAMFGRVGAVGVEAASISATGSQANGGVWLTPMYKSVDSDGFNAEGASYGSDVDLSGVAFGTDTVNGNMRFGAVFNIGSGDAEGKGNGNGLKDEFDYYGFGIYSAMGFGNFALVGDASMTVISHEVEGLGLRGKADTTAVTMGVTGQYTVATPVVDVTPHLGARFIRLNTDSYDLISANGVEGTTDFDVQNVFSVPLGVTLSKGFITGDWTLAPSADLTIAFNTGDTEAKSNTFIAGKNIGLNTEVLDEVTYGVTLGLGAQNGAFGTSFGINYTGSSNTDSFGVNAQARYMF
ncbi:beta strand repeat-containing protein [Anaerobiospirillum succiniciproducens]|uniref:beta strand repeat-containing protein n=1 Tax=Anaerobiospirillum succiniciproducens TaxID=13335 RepID=UPI003F893F52